MRLLLIFTAIITMTACTDNVRSRKFGGTAQRDLIPGKRLVMITWKDSDMWLLTRDRHPDEKPERYEFKEDSNLGLLNGTVIVVEH